MRAPVHWRGAGPERACPAPYPHGAAAWADARLAIDDAGPAPGRVRSPPTENGRPCGTPATPGRPDCPTGRSAARSLRVRAPVIKTSPGARRGVGPSNTSRMLGEEPRRGAGLRLVDTAGAGPGAEAGERGAGRIVRLGSSRGGGWALGRP